jgi:pyridoxine 4-dehydrogenase
MTSSAPRGTLTLAANLTLGRMGYGATRLAGPGVFGPPKDRDEALAVLRENIAAADLVLPADATTELDGIGQ